MRTYKCNSVLMQLGRNKSGRIIATLLASLMLSSCATSSSMQSGGSIENVNASAPGWQIDSVVAKCVASVAGGAILGGLIGSAVGGRNGVGAGVLVGASAGGALCAVLSALDEQDRARIRNAQAMAAKTGQPQVLNYRGQDGLERQVSVRPTDVGAASKPRPAPAGGRPKQSEAQIAAASGQRICRTLNTTVNVQSKGQADVPAQVVCRTPDGDYEPA